MKKVLACIGQLLFLGLAATGAAVLGLWLAVILGTESRMKQSFADTLRLAQTVPTVAVELLNGGGSPGKEEDYTLNPDKISQATLMLMKDTGVSGIFRTGEIHRFSRPEDLKHLADEFNRLIGRASLDRNRLIKAGTPFYLILLDFKGQRHSYEFIGEELFLNDGTHSRLVRRQTLSDEPPLDFDDLLGTKR